MSVYETARGKTAVQCDKCHECLMLPVKVTVEPDGTVLCGDCSEAKPEECEPK